ncbi:MAG: flagellar biosynthesis protein FlhB [Candidatus Goldiibacteriota bacterium]
MAEPGKTEKATPKKKDEARKKGQVAKSMEVNSMLNVLMGFVVLMIAGTYMLHGMKDLAGFFWGNVLTYDISMESMKNFIFEVIIKTLLIMLPVFIVLFITGIASNILQVGFKITWEPIKPKISNINPVKGLKRIFSRRTLFELVKAIMKVTVIGYLFYTTVKKMFDEIFLTPLMEIEMYLMFAASTALALGLKVVAAFVVFALIDYLFQKWQFEDNLKMSKQEVKDEMKQLEGDPMVKSRIKNIQREMARQRMISEIPGADVVITNPTHIAVALKYEENGEKAPMIVAKGVNLMAEKIKTLARENQIVIMENPPLARELVKYEVGWEIPPELFQAVAEVLAYVYQAKGKIKLEEKAKKLDNTNLESTLTPNGGM